MGARAEVQEGTTLRSAARSHGVAIDSVCGERATGTHPGTCPNCGSEVRNVAVPRE
jgi:uncharacterized 2Fe-2S/4Fe-4S cluster protein (DUF4445 family)